MSGHNELRKTLKQYKRIAIVLDGSAVSAYLVKEAAAVLGAENVLALTASTEFLPPQALALAYKIAELADVRHVVVPISVIDEHNVMRNASDRCYYCKLCTLRALKEEAWKHGYDTVCDALCINNSNDQSGAYLASKELDVVCPFILCGMDSAQISSTLGCDGLEQPYCQCFAKRIQIGREITLDEIETLCAQAVCQ